MKPLQYTAQDVTNALIDPMLPTRAGRSSINMEGGARSDSLRTLLDAVVAQTRDRIVQGKTGSA